MHPSRFSPLNVPSWKAIVCDEDEFTNTYRRRWIGVRITHVGESVGATSLQKGNPEVVTLL
jgi:hypothetical protein